MDSCTLLHECQGILCIPGTSCADLLVLSVPQGCKRPLTYDFMRNVVESLGRKVGPVLGLWSMLPCISMANEVAIGVIDNVFRVCLPGGLRAH